MGALRAPITPQPLLALRAYKKIIILKKRNIQWVWCFDRIKNNYFKKKHRFKSQ
jgi:hypothetical protein